LRFPEFKGEWEKKKLGEIAQFSKGKGIPTCGHFFPLVGCWPKDSLP